MPDSLHPRRRWPAAALLAVLTCSIATLLPAEGAEDEFDDWPGMPGVVVNTTAGDITVADGVTLTITSLTDITGVASATHIVRADSLSDRHFAFLIKGAAGSLRAAGGVRIGTTTTLTLDESTSYSGVAGGRLSDTAPLELDSGTLSYINTRLPAIDLSETIGTLRIGGYSTLELGTNSTSNYGSTTLVADQLERLNRGTFQVAFTGTLGSGTTRAAYVRFTNAPPTTAGGVVPYATAQKAKDTGPYGVVVYEPANGLRLLSSAEYLPNFTGATAASDVLLGSSTTFTNDAALTVRTLSVGGSTVLAGNGSVALTSGLLMHTGGDATVNNSIAFGNQEAFIAVPGQSNTELTFLKPVTGSGGLTVYGRSVVAFPGGNQITGDLVLNGEARIRIDSLADLGPATTAIQVNGLEAGAGIRTSSALNFTRPVQVNSGYFSVSPRAGTLTLSGGISGGGGVFVRAGAGDVLLTGTNTYTGPTMVEGNFSFTSDAAFGTSRSIVLDGGTIKLLSNWTTSRLLEQAELAPTATYLDTNGFDANFQGAFSSLSNMQSLVKTGAGRLLLTVPLATTGMTLQVTGGQVVLQGGGSATGISFIASSGGLLLVDQSAGAVARGSLDVSVGGGEYKILGNATATTTIQGHLYAPGPYGFATFAPAGNAPILLNLSDLLSFSSGYVVVRATQLGTASTGAYTRLRFSNVPFLDNGVIPGVLADASLTGLGQSFTTYDKTSDVAGVIGVRALKASEFANTPTLKNPLNGGTTATTANFLANGVVAVSGLANTVNTLTLAPGSRLDLAARQSLTVSETALLVQAGAMAEVGGGTLLPTSSPVSTLTTVGEGDLRFGATLPALDTLAHAGPGQLQVTGRQRGDTISMINGTLQVGAGDPMLKANVLLGVGTQFNLLGATTTIGSLGGLGTLNLAGGTVQLQGTVSFYDFAGQLAGAGAFLSLTTQGPSLTGSNPSFTGTAGAINGVLGISGTLPNLAGLLLKGGTVNLDNYTAASAAPRVGVVPVDSRSGTLTLLPLPNTDTATSLGTLTGEGLSRVVISHTTVGTSATEGRLTFANLARASRGTFQFSSSLSSNRTARFDVVQDLTPTLIGDTSAASSQPVLPYGIFNGHVATFTPGAGLRALAASEQVSTFTAGQNVKTVLSGTLNSVVPVNSYEMADPNVTLSGTGMLQVASGLIVLQGSLSLLLDFGQAEGQVFVPNSASVAQLTKTISGSNGLTISANGYNLALTGNNTFTGPLTINGAQVNYNTAAALGADTSPVVLAGGWANYNGSSGSTATVARGFEVRGAGGHLTANSSFMVTVTGPITGPGDLYLSNAELTNTSSTYAGTTFLSGNVRFASDAVFGQSPRLDTSGASSVVLTGAWTSARRLHLEVSPLVLDTGGFGATLNGPLTGTQKLTKSGAGLLAINGGVEFEGPLQVSGGTVQLNSDLGTDVTANSVTVDVSGRLEGSSGFNRAVLLNGTLAPGVGANVGAIESGNLTMGAGSKLELQAIATDAFDQVRVNGTVTFSGLVQLTLGISGLSGTPAFQWPLLLNDGTDAITVSATKAFAIGATPLTEGAQFSVSGFNATITYKGGDGNDIYVSVPEPGGAALGGLGVVALLARRPARRRSTPSLPSCTW